MSDGPPAAADPCGTRCRRLDDHTVEVERNLVRELVTGAARPGAMRFLPQVDHGEVKGVKLYGVTPTTIAYALGMKNGDTLTTVDGAPLTNLQQLLDLYAKLDQVNRVELSGLRGGKPLAIDLRLR